MITLRHVTHEHASAFLAHQVPNTRGCDYDRMQVCCAAFLLLDHHLLQDRLQFFFCALLPSPEHFCECHFPIDLICSRNTFSSHSQFQILPIPYSSTLRRVLVGVDDQFCRKRLVLCNHVVFATAVSVRAWRPSSPISGDTHVVACVTSFFCTTSLGVIGVCILAHTHHRNNLRNVEDCTQERIHQMTALTQPLAHALQNVSWTTGGSHLGWKLQTPRHQANYRYLPKVRTATHIAGDEFRGWAILTD